MRTVLRVLFIMIGAIAVLGCKHREPLFIGVSVELTGRHGDLGVQARNGAILAAETLNAEGGIDGRPVELVIRDDTGTPDGAVAADQELIEAGVAAIIGHITSGQTLAAYHVTEAAGVVLISPTTSTWELNGRKDHFFRLVTPNTEEGRVIAQHCVSHLHLARVAIIDDTDNANFTQTLMAAFTQHYERLGGRITAAINFSSSSEPDFAALTQTLEQSQPDGVFIIASAFDTALIAQHIRLRGWSVPLVSSGWAQTQHLIHKGGQAVEGLQILQTFDPTNSSPAYRDFETRFEARFGEIPPIYAGHSYDAVFILAAALRATRGRSQGVAEALLKLRNFPGISGDITFDEYGEVQRPWFLLTIRNGEFVTLEPFMLADTP